MPSTFERSMVFLNMARDHGREFFDMLEENGFLEEFREHFTDSRDLADVIDYMSDGVRNKAFDIGVIP